MKKIFILLLIFNIFLISSCAPRITYTEEFPFLPAYRNMILETDEEEAGEEKEEPKVEPGQLVKKTYVVENVEADNVLTEYEEILKQDGWTITYDGKPQMLEVQKGDHQAMLVVYGQDEVINLDITAK